jgi:uncharacterized membrane protein YqiK
MLFIVIIIVIIIIIMIIIMITKDAVLVEKEQRTQVVKDRINSLQDEFRDMLQVCCLFVIIIVKLGL